MILFLEECIYVVKEKIPKYINDDADIYSVEVTKKNSENENYSEE